MRVGAIDCGTNSIRLLIADVALDGTLTDVVREMKVVRLGEGVDATGQFSQAALDRTFTAAREYAHLLEEHGVTAVRFAATSASRDASNREVFISGIQQILGVTPEVITGVEEANLSFAGAVSSVGNTEENTVVIDLGGGSTEFVMGNDNGVQQAISLNIGCVRLTERHSVDTPLTKAQERLILADVDTALDEVAENLNLAEVQRIVGVAGTVTTVMAQTLGLTSYDSDAINGSERSIDEVMQGAQELASMTRNQRMATGFMHEGRVDVIGTGATIWSRIVDRLRAESSHDITSVIASEHDILDGLALSLTR